MLLDDGHCAVVAGYKGVDSQSPNTNSCRELIVDC
uniref:Uncharacterized protein n=1 Tax=Nelumbo nucifera TaxID=4432 RepID=A0A822ZP88_NELNU|nr:TPA_asm: hypothetical protein HUJ06_016999 [Nelumbo nucifera]